MSVGRRLRFLLAKQHQTKTDKSSPEDEKRRRVLACELKTNIDAVLAEFRNSCDLIVREFSFGKEGRTGAAVLYLDGMIDAALISDHMIQPLMEDSSFSDAGSRAGLGMRELTGRLLTGSDAAIVRTLDEVAHGCLSGDAVLLVDGLCQAVLMSAKGWEERPVSEPSTETVVKGPREGFTENLRTNITMIRRKIRDPALVIREIEIGDRTHTRVSMIYMDGIANPALVQEIERRLKNIDTDLILAAGYLEQYIEDTPWSIFQTIWYSERPDAIAGKLMEGRAAIALDGTPFVLSAPMLFLENFQSPEDYAIRSYYATGLRLLRLCAFLISMLAPATYVSLSTFHQELIPTDLLITMAAASEGVPFPAAVEVGIMMFTFDVLKEAGVRMPRPVGQAISIVGALVMGQSAVQAGLVGAPVVIVIAMTAVSSFVAPFAADAVSILRWIFLIMAATMGSFGITLGLLALLIYLASLKTFSTNYLAPFAPFDLAQLKDSIVRAPLWSMRTRPRTLKPQDLQRQNFKIPYDPAAGRGDNQGEKP